MTFFQTHNSTEVADIIRPPFFAIDDSVAARLSKDVFQGVLFGGFIPREQSGRMRQKYGTYQKINSIHHAFKCSSGVKREKTANCTKALCKWFLALSWEQEQEGKKTKTETALWKVLLLAPVALASVSCCSLSHRILQYVRDPFLCIHQVEQIPSDRTNTCVVSQLAWNAALQQRCGVTEFRSRFALFEFRLAKLISHWLRMWLSNAHWKTQVFCY